MNFITILLIVVLLLIIVLIRFTFELRQSRNKLESKNKEQSLLLNNIQTQIWYLKDINCYGKANKAHLNFMGIDEDSIENKSLFEVWKEEEAVICIQGNKDVFENKKKLTKEEWIENAEGKKRLLSITKAPSLDKHGQVKYVICSAEDITEQKNMEEQIIELAREYEVIFSNTQDAFFLVDVIEKEQFKYNRINFSYINLAGFSMQDVKGKTPREVYGKRLGKQIESRYKECVKKQEAISYDEKLDLSEKEIICHTSLAPVVVEDKVVQIVGSSRDITERRKMEEKIKHLTFHDSLTGLYNRDYFNEELNRYDTERQLPLSIIIGDVNGLKLTNDAFGHQTGDQLLIKVARIIEDSCRQEDLIARWGGDEYIILLPHTKEETVRKICTRIKQACEKADSDPIKPSIALGYASKKSRNESINEVFKKAEDWMYKSKLNESKNAHNTIISSLKETLRQETFETKEHILCLKKMARKLGKTLNLSEYELRDLELLAELHDLGKVAISKSIIKKEQALTSAEWDEIKKHPEIGYKIASSSPELGNIAEGILSHHEWWDGSGYPRGLEGTEIPIIARIISIVDAYDIMIRGKPYKGSISKKEAKQKIQEKAGSQFDPELVDKFINQVL